MNTLGASGQGEVGSQCSLLLLHHPSLETEWITHASKSIIYNKLYTQQLLLLRIILNRNLYFYIYIFIEYIYIYINNI